MPLDRGEFTPVVICIRTPVCHVSYNRRNRAIIYLYIDDDMLVASYHVCRVLISHRSHSSTDIIAAGGLNAIALSSLHTESSVSRRQRRRIDDHEHRVSRSRRISRHVDRRIDGRSDGGREGEDQEFTEKKVSYCESIRRILITRFKLCILGLHGAI